MGEPATQTTTYLGVQAKALPSMQAPGIYRIDLQVKRLQNMSVAECAIPFCWKGLLASEMFRYVDYMRVQDVVRGHPGFSNVDTNAPRLPIKKWFLETA